MKSIILLCFAIALYGCNDLPNKNGKMDWSKITIDSCQYIAHEWRSDAIIHAGDCTNHDTTSGKTKERKP